MIRRCRRQAGLTQKELAQRAGTTQSLLARYEAGDVIPTVDALVRLVGSCGYDIETRTTPLQPPMPLTGPIGKLAVEHRNEIRRIAHRMGSRRVRVFGSVARGEDTPNSDLDILVDFPVREKGLLPLAHLADELSELLNVPVDVSGSEALSDKVAATALVDAVIL